MTGSSQEDQDTTPLPDLRSDTVHGRQRLDAKSFPDCKHYLEFSMAISLVLCLGIAFIVKARVPNASFTDLCLAGAGFVLLQGALWLLRQIRGSTGEAEETAYQRLMREHEPSGTTDSDAIPARLKPILVNEEYRGWTKAHAIVLSGYSLLFGLASLQTFHAALGLRLEKLTIGLLIASLLIGLIDWRLADTLVKETTGYDAVGRSLLIADCGLATFASFTPIGEQWLWFCWLLTIPVLGLKCLFWHRDRFCITSKRLILVLGFTRKEYPNMQLRQMTDATPSIPQLSTYLTFFRITNTHYGQFRVKTAASGKSLGSGSGDSESDLKINLVRYVPDAYARGVYISDAVNRLGGGDAGSR